MKKIIIALVVAALGIGLYYTFFVEESPAKDNRITDEALGLSFEYLDGYAALEVGAGTTTPEIIKTIVFMDEAEYQSIINGEREGGEGPPSIIILGQNNPENLSPETWAAANPGLSSYELRTGETRSVTVDGREALQYEADGLYANRNVIFTEDEKIYLVNGSFLDRDSEIYRDFDRFVESIRFIE